MWEFIDYCFCVPVYKVFGSRKILVRSNQRLKKARVQWVISLQMNT